MTPRAFTAHRERIGWSRVQLAKAIGLDESQVRRWESGKAAIPEPLAAWMRAAAEWIRKNPPPQAPYPRGTGRPEP